MSGAPPQSAAVATLHLTARQRRQLRGLAHPLEPCVQVGHSGITGRVVSAVEQALLDHELVKVKMREPEDKKAMAAALADATSAALCGLLGHTVILYRPHPERPKIALAAR